ncbi:MAG: hypothetical protein VB051_01540 [Candidatus Pelethousia sp.]|nr:hypothetical protein [Candidatus Pelethousia sp.]
MNELDRRLSSYVWQTETPPPASAAALRARLAQRRAARAERWLLALSCLLSLLLALLGIWLLRLIAAIDSRWALTSLGMGLGLWGSLLAGGAALWQARLDESKNG